jgi:ribonucleoside-diphosphate reductase alpha chain
MKVRNREGESLDISYDEIKKRISRLCTQQELESIDIDKVVIQTINGIYDGITTWELDDLSARVCAAMQSQHVAYDSVASKITVSNLAKSVRRRLEDKGFRATFSGKVAYIASVQPRTYSDEFVEFVARNAEGLDAITCYDRDCTHSYFALRTMERSYLLKDGALCIESPQDMWLRVAVAVNMGQHAAADGSGDVLGRIAQCYHHMSLGDFTHATPTLFNAGTPHNLSSCYLLGTDDSLAGIFKTVGDCAQISKWAGGIGVHVSNIRARGSTIKSTNGTSDGIVPMLKVYNEMARYCNQAGRRKGSVAVYLEPWHADVWEFVELRRNVGAETERARDLFLALWIPDEFMTRLEADDDWYLMTPDECPGLVDAVGSAFSELYARYIAEGRFVRKVKARSLWQHVLNCQLETGTPYVLFKDHVNRKCNQSNVGTIRSSNLCVAPETLVLTSEGYFPISDLAGRTVRVWNGAEFSSVSVVKTGQGQRLLTVVLSDGYSLTCTEYHKFYVVDDSPSSKCQVPERMSALKLDDEFRGESPVREVRASELEPNMRIEPFRLPVLDGALLKSTPDFVHKSRGPSPYEHARRSPVEELFVPVNFGAEVKLRWLEGLADRAASLNPRLGLRLPPVEAETPEYSNRLVARLVDTLGAAGSALTPDGWLELRPPVLARLQDLGFSPRLVALETRARKNGQRAELHVVAVLDQGRVDDTYCFTEPLAGRGVFDGVLAGNCAEITEYSDASEYAVCNLASIAVNRFVSRDGGVDHARLHEVAKLVTRNLNRIIDINGYPTPETSKSNLALRPVGIGIQGLGDAYCVLRMPYDDPRAALLDAEIMETIYHGALEASAELAEVHGPYPRFEGSPMAEGRLQFDMWGFDPATLGAGITGSRPQWDWGALRARIARTGARNSMLTALMPTASTSQILGNCECFEPIQSNVFKRGTLAGEFLVVNKHLMAELMALGLWSDDMRRSLIASDGSVQGVPGIPDDLRSVYRTVWEVPLRAIIDHAVARGPFVDQSQSMNLFMAQPSFQRLSSALVYGWRRGLKTGMYYLRSTAAVEAIKYGIMDSSSSKKDYRPEEDAAPACRRGGDPSCLMCSS